MFSTPGVTWGAFHHAWPRPSLDAPLVNGSGSRRAQRSHRVAKVERHLHRERCCSEAVWDPRGRRAALRAWRLAATVSHSTPRGTCWGNHRLLWTEEASGACCRRPSRNKQTQAGSTDPPALSPQVADLQAHLPWPRPGFSADSCSALALSESELLLPCLGGVSWFLDPAHA